MFTDTHCHLTDDYCSGDKLNDVLAHAHDASVTRLICATANPEDIAPAIKIAETHDNIFVTTGIHPEYADINPHEYLTASVLSHPRVVGVGEIGLDYHERDDNRTEQIKLFNEQLEIARSMSTEKTKLMTTPLWIAFSTLCCTLTGLEIRYSRWLSRLTGIASSQIAR